MDFLAFFLSLPSLSFQNEKRNPWYKPDAKILSCSLKRWFDRGRSRLLSCYQVALNYYFVLALGWDFLDLSYARMLFLCQHRSISHEINVFAKIITKRFYKLMFLNITIVTDSLFAWIYQVFLISSMTFTILFRFQKISILIITQTYGRILNKESNVFRGFSSCVLFSFFSYPNKTLLPHLAFLLRSWLLRDQAAFSTWFAARGSPSIWFFIPRV